MILINFEKAFKNGFAILLVTTIFLIGLEYILNESGHVPTNKTVPISYSKQLLNANLIELCETQWEKLNQFVFFRPQLIYFYTDLNQLRLFFQLNSDRQIPNLNYS